jgi:hypothetical protein
MIAEKSTHCAEKSTHIGECIVNKPCNILIDYALYC